MITPEPPAISEDTRRRVEEELRTWGSAGSDARARFEVAQAKWGHVLQPIEDAILASERLTEKDLSIRINIRDSRAW